MHMSRLDGKVAVVTGGASGIGKATARLFLAEGARGVVIGDMQRDVGESVVHELGPKALFVECDVSHEEAVSGLVRLATEEFGRIDVMFNNAGFGGASGPIDSISESDFNLTIDVLLKGVFFGMKHAAKAMKKQSTGGSIISTSSGAGIRTGTMPHLYATAKAAVIHLTKSVANELADAGIRVNCVCPGFVVTPATVAPPGAQRPLSEIQEEIKSYMDQTREDRRSGVPLGRVGEAEDIASAVLFFASDESNWITGEALLIDGGAMTGPPWRDRPTWITQPSPITLYRPEDR
jgi:NAD(P)-dependent dehydrogenase (short-subunit alcohol dehydrogenase family)